MKNKKFQWKWHGAVAFMLTVGLHFSYGQNYEKMHLVGEHLSNFSITEMCCGDEGYVAAGTRGQNQDVLIIAMDDQGNPVWSETLDNDVVERAAHIETVSEGYALTGFTRASGGFNRVFFVLLDASGAVQISKMYFDPNQPNWQLQGAHVLEVQNGDGYLITGYYKEYGVALTSQKSVMVLRLDPAGNLMWGKLYDSPDDGRADFDMGAFGMETERGFYITGSANVEKDRGLSTQGVLNMFIDFNGNIVWNNNFALDPGTDFTDNSDLGTSALYSKDEGAIVLSANTTLTTNFYLTKVDPASGALLNQRSYVVDLDYTPSYYLGQNERGDFVVAGMLESTPVRYDCNGTPTVYSAVPYITEISNDLSTVWASKKHPMYAPSFSTDDGSVFHSHFGGPANLKRPLITTPEMAYTHKDGDRTVWLGYREDGPAGKYDLQFMSSQSPDYEWCVTEDMSVDVEETDPIYGKDMDPTDFSDLDQVQGDQETLREGLTLDCSTSIASGSGQFPIVQTSTSGSSVRGTRGYQSDRNIVVKDGYSYVIGQFTGSMNNPSLSSTSSDARPWLAKYDPNGNLIWGKKADGTTGYNNGISSVSVDDANNVYVTGHFTNGNLTFDGDPYPAMTSGVTLGNGGWSAYVIKYDANGVFQWRAMMLPDLSVFGSSALASDLVVGDDGYLYVTGITTESVEFYTNNYSPDPIMGGSSSVSTTPAHLFHAFVAKYDPANGQLVFFESESTVTANFSNFHSRTIQVDPSGSIYLGGDKFDGTLIINYPMLVKTNASGIVTGVTSNSATATATMYTMTLHGGHLYVGGWLESSLNFAGCSVSGLDHDGWFARIDKNTLGCSSLNTVTDGTAGYISAFVSDIEVHGNGDVYVLGHYSGSTANFTNGGSLSLTGNQDLFLAKYNTALSASSWEQNFGGSGTSVTTGTIVEDDINCGSFITGSFTGGTVDLGPSSGVISAPTGVDDHFVARIDALGASYKTGGSAVGSAEEGLESAVVEVYPNPASGIFYLEGIQLGDQVEVFNTNGSLMRTAEVKTQENLGIKCEHWPAGLYLIRVVRGEKVVQKKILLD